jgi:hypothetical protein
MGNKITLGLLKQLIREELNVLKKGKIRLNEQDEGWSGVLNLSNGGVGRQQATNIGAMNYKLLTELKRFGFSGAEVRYKNIPGKSKESIIIPQVSIKTISGGSYRANYVSITPEILSEIEEMAKNIAAAIIIANKIGKLEEFLGNGIQVTSSADSDVPREVNINNTDHGNNGGKLYGGAKTPYEKNSWLASKRGQNILKVLITKIVSRCNSISPELGSTVNDILTSKSKVSIINHLNPDGTSNKSKMGENFKSIVIKPLFATEKSVPDFGTTPDKTAKTTKEGTKIGYIQVSAGSGSNTMIEVYQSKDDTGNTVWGVLENIELPIYNGDSIDGQTKPVAEIRGIIGVGGEMYINNKFFGKFTTPTKSNIPTIAVAQAIVKDYTGGRKINVGGMMLIPVAYLQVKMIE